MRQSSIRFNAGKVQYDEDTRKCTPLPQKGYITIVPSTDDPDFLSFTWKCKDSTAGTVENDELLLIPGDVSFKHVKNCTTGRVFALTFLSSGAKHLYWLQDVGDIDQLGKLTDKDKNIVKDVVDAITLDDDEDDEEQGEFNVANAGQTPAGLAPATADTAASQGESTTNQTGTTSNQATQDALRQALQLIKPPVASIRDLLTPQEVEAHLNSLTHEEIKEKYGHLMPECMHATPHEIMSVVRCAFFDQAEQRLSEQVRSGGGYLVAQALGYDYKGENVEGMVRGIRSKYPPNTDEDEEMKEA